jgi:hypothetical protein
MSGASIAPGGEHSIIIHAEYWSPQSGGAGKDGRKLNFENRKILSSKV